MTAWDGEAYHQGWLACHVHKQPIDANPYDVETNAFLHDSWQEGWINASNRRV